MMTFHAHLLSQAMPLSRVLLIHYPSTILLLARFSYSEGVGDRIEEKFEENSDQVVDKHEWLRHRRILLHMSRTKSPSGHSRLG